MPIPLFQQLTGPVLSLMSDAKSRRRPEIILAMEDHFNLDDEERSLRLNSGSRVIKNRTNWAITYLHKADLLEIPSRGNIRITQAGNEVASKSIEPLDIDALKEQSSQFREWMEANRKAGISRRKSKKETIDSVGMSGPDTPEEVLVDALQSIRESLVSELHERIVLSTPEFFERLVVDVLEAMGYGGDFEGSAKVTPYIKDGGIDGIIQQDKLGLETVYVQAKRQQANVGRPALQAFVGAMQGEGVRKGVFVTTSDFTSDARSYVDTIEARLVLVDGRRLANLMVDHDVGVSKTHEFVIKRLDGDYFEDAD